MINTQFIDELANKLSEVMPEGVSELQKDVDKNIKAVLQNTLTKFNLVTREEFEVQSRVLARTREKLEQLEQQVAELEKNLLDTEKKISPD